MSLKSKKCTILLIDDDKAVRESLQSLLESNNYPVRCFDSAESFLAHYDPSEITCLLADIHLRGMSGLELQDHLIGCSSSIPIVFMTGYGDISMAVSSMKKGALDFIQKPFIDKELLTLVNIMSERAQDTFAERQYAASRDKLLSKLTYRESQVLDRIVAGRLNKQIADDLGISIKTVEAHRAHLMRKFGANTVAKLLKIALGSSPEDHQPVVMNRTGFRGGLNS